MDNKKSLLNWSNVSKYRTELMGVAAIFILIFHTIMVASNDMMFCPNIYDESNPIKHLKQSYKALIAYCSFSV